MGASSLSSSFRPAYCAQKGWRRQDGCKGYAKETSVRTISRRFSIWEWVPLNTERARGRTLPSLFPKDLAAQAQTRITAIHRKGRPLRSYASDPPNETLPATLLIRWRETGSEARRRNRRSMASSAPNPSYRYEMGGPPELHVSLTSLKSYAG